jgi:hypothetical protein
MLKKEKRKDLRRKRVKDNIYSNGLNKKWRNLKGVCYFSYFNFPKNRFEDNSHFVWHAALKI